MRAKLYFNLNLHFFLSSFSGFSSDLVRLPCFLPFPLPRLRASRPTAYVDRDLIKIPRRFRKRCSAGTTPSPAIADDVADLRLRLRLRRRARPRPRLQLRFCLFTRFSRIHYV